MELFAREIGEYIETIPPMKRIHEDWYLGTADAVYQNSESISAENPEFTLILSGDQIYKMDYHEMVDWHIPTVPMSRSRPSRSRRKKRIASALSK